MEYFIIIIIYFILVLVISFFLKKSKSQGEFTTAQNSLSIVSLSIILISAYFGGGIILGGSELGYSYGLKGWIYGLSAAFGILFFALFLLNKMYNTKKKFEIKTISRYLGVIYNNKKLALFSSLLSIFALTIIASAQLFALSRILFVIGFPFKTTLFFIALIIAIVSSKGIKAFSKFSKINLIIAIIGVIIAFIFAISGGYSKIQEGSFNNMKIDSLLSFIIPTISFVLIGQDLHQKIYSAKNKKTAFISCIIAFIILSILSLLPVIIGMQSKYLFNVSPADSMPEFIVYGMPSFFRGIFISAILAAVIGCSQSLISSAATQVSEDLFKETKKFKNFDLSKISFYSSFIISLVAFVISIYSTSIINLLISSYQIYCSAFFVPFIASFYIKHPENISKNIIYVALSGIIIFLIFETKLLNTPFNIPSIIISFVVSLITLGIFCIVKRQINQQVDIV